MMYTVILDKVSVGDTIDIKKSLINDYGLVIDRDFTWAWIPRELDNFGYNIKTAAHAKFTFTNESNAVFFQLKFSK